MKNEFDYLNDTEIDFSIYDEQQLTKKERRRMKNVIKKHQKINYLKLAGLAACVALVAVFAQTALAQEFFVKIIKSVSTGYNTFVETDSDGAAVPVPVELSGLIFDKNGLQANKISSGETYYDKNGKKITDLQKFAQEYTDSLTIVNADGTETTVNIKDAGDSDPLINAAAEGWVVISDPEKINDYLDFSAKLPKYVPEGFRFYGATASPTDGQYLFVYYKNDKTEKCISVHERILNEETAFSASFDGKMTETKIHGNKAVIYDGRNIDWEEDGISIGISAKNAVSKAELLKIADSVK
ncbi:MAG: DUF4367 domain-containing protein [Firmicutes bacterium]|nr:DUF4367 domain-containing protein [Bacillota bacterium]